MHHKYEAEAGDAASTSWVKVPGGHPIIRSARLLGTLIDNQPLQALTIHLCCPNNTQPDIAFPITLDPTKYVLKGEYYV
jgi:hypothetical protein